ncbi:TadE/TadG family type IV pilus assembly protein [Nitrosomonas sp. Nm34]|uniref:TadE/TadG family type IV pilus assembly protein n=1 Tax=Nitrosomonas sp. Nm34 TaxID=1881055 RepID=UPI0008E26200|nr:TadE/TadG family type IV pilus assembly protein [Nitrosomonas sp. Nm34]SFI27492.1 Flp pilus assembly protein TadG [Nitrosomonas sp. Nm34]
MKIIERFNPKLISINRFNQRGAAAVQFALIASVLFTAMIGAMEMSRVLFYWNTATEATRLGARLAVVCDQNAAAIKTKMQSMLGVLNTSNITVKYVDQDGNSCSRETCRFVTVSITGLTVSTVIPLVPLNITMPPFTTTLPRESLTNILKDGSVNPDCK